MGNTLLIFGVAGLAVNRAVDFVRTAFDKKDRVPKAWWLLLAQGIGIGVAYGVAHSSTLLRLLGIPEVGAFQTVLVGMGVGGVSSFLHELMSALSSVSGRAPTPKGLKMAPKRRPPVPKPAAKKAA